MGNGQNGDMNRGWFCCRWPARWRWQGVEPRQRCLVIEEPCPALDRQSRQRNRCWLCNLCQHGTGIGADVVLSVIVVIAITVRCVRRVGCLVVGGGHIDRFGAGGGTDDHLQHRAIIRQRRHEADRDQPADKQAENGQKDDGDASGYGLRVDP